MFAADPLAGNQLAVVHDADGLDDATMLAFARETNLSETTFVQSADGSADYVNRIFITTGEMPFAGHPSLGTAVAVAYARGDSTARYVQRTQAGEQPIEVALDGRGARASMLQEPATFGAAADPAAVAAATGIDIDDVDPAIAPQAVSTGVWHLIVVLRDAAVLDKVSIQRGADALTALVAPLGATCCYLAAPTTTHERWSARSLFVGQTGVVEDPATGSAAGPLCALLAERSGITELTIDQGVQMGRPSVLTASIDGDRPRVGGDVHVVSDGTVWL